MPSLTRKIIKGRSYYYARWCQRVGGRPKIVKTAYLGPLENIVQAVETAQQPLPPHTAEVSQFADVAALYHQAAQLGLIELSSLVVKRGDVSELGDLRGVGRQWLLGGFDSLNDVF